MPHAERTEISPIIGIYQELRTLQPAWYVEMGRPHGTGWITGTDLRMASEGPFNDLLSHIGDRLHTADRRTIAAAFALRYGWSAGMAIAPCLLGDCVPTITLDNVSFKFGANTLFERVALHHPTGVMLHPGGGAPHPLHPVAPEPPCPLTLAQNESGATGPTHCGHLIRVVTVCAGKACGG